VKKMLFNLLDILIIFFLLGIVVTGAVYPISLLPAIWAIIYFITYFMTTVLIIFYYAEKKDV
jgi:hypothetical protein